MNVLFVCSSNVCRSPYCEFLLRRLVNNDERLKGKVNVCSSAVFNRSKKIFPKAVDILVREGFDRDEVLAHKPSFKDDKERFEKADVIIGMSKMHGLMTPKNIGENTARSRKSQRENTLPSPIRFLPRRKSPTIKRWRCSKTTCTNITKS